MKRFSTWLTTLISVMLCIYGCTDYEEMYRDDTMLPQTSQTRAMQFSLDDAVYHRTTDFLNLIRTHSIMSSVRTII